MDYRNRSKELVQDVRRVLLDAIKDTSQKGISITVRRQGDSVLLHEVLSTIKIDKEIFEYLTSVPSKKKHKELTKCYSVGELLRVYSSLKQVKAHIDAAISDIRAMALEPEQIDYLRELYHCYAFSEATLKASRRTKRTKDKHFQEYCSLCWRLIFKYQYLNLGQDNYSNHYCIVHHPKQNDNIYHRDRTRLISAVTKRGRPEELDKIKLISAPLSSRSKSARYLYSLTNTFSEYPREELILFSKNNSKHWQQSIDNLLKITSKYYAEAYIKLQGFNLTNCDSWVSFFSWVIQTLDPDGYDTESWKETKELLELANVSDQVSHNSSLISWRTLLRIIHRYQAFYNIAKVPQPRGPKKGTIPKNEELRLKIKSIAQIQQIEKGRINASQIAIQVNCSNTRVGQLLKEMGLR